MENTEATPVAPVTPVVAPAPATPPADPNWLPGRLEQHTRSLLKELGVTNVDEIKAAVKAAQDAALAKKTAEERAALAATELTTLKAQADAYAATIKARAEREFAALTPEQQSAVKSLAGEDFAAQLRTIDAFAPTWSKPAAPAAPAAAPIAAPATTAPANPGPAPGTPGAQPNHRATWEAMNNPQSPSTYNPVAAAHYLAQHQREIFAAQNP